MLETFLTSFFIATISTLQQVGCDGVIGSNKTLDSCGVCNGNNKLCSQTNGSINTFPKEGNILNDQFVVVLIMCLKKVIKKL